MTLRNGKPFKSESAIPNTENTLSFTELIDSFSIDDSLSTDDEVFVIKQDMEAFKTAITLIPEFAGEPSELPKFLDSCMIAKELFTTADKLTILDAIKVRLTGRAYDLITINNYKSFEEVVKGLQENLLSTTSYEQLRGVLLQTRQQDTETIKEYGLKIKSLLHDINTARLQKLPISATEDIKKPIRKENESLATWVFTNNLFKNEIKTFMKAARFESLNMAIAAAEKECALSHIMAQSDPQRNSNLNQNNNNYNQRNYRSQNQNYSKNYQYKPSGYSPQKSQNQNYSQNYQYKSFDYSPQNLNPRNNVGNNNYNTYYKDNYNNNSNNNRELVRYRPNNNSQPNQIKVEQIYCSFCRMRGHTTERCRYNRNNDNKQKINIVNQDSDFSNEKNDPGTSQGAMTALDIMESTQQ